MLICNLRKKDIEVYEKRLGFYMRILLINPPWIRLEGNIWNNVASVMPPLGLAWIATTLEQAGHSVKILDAHAERIDFDGVMSYLDGQDEKLWGTDGFALAANRG